MPTSGVGQPTSFIRGPVAPIQYGDSTGSIATAYIISGVTRDLLNAPLGGVTVNLFDTGTQQLVLSTVSDVNGNYTFNVTGQHTFWAIAYKPGSPDVFGTTANTLTGG